MPTIQIDGKNYDTDTLSEEAKKQLSGLQIVDNEIRHLQVQQGIANTARNVYVQLLKVALANQMSGDTIKQG